MPSKTPAAKPFEATANRLPPSYHQIERPEVLFGDVEVQWDHVFRKKDSSSKSSYMINVEFEYCSSQPKVNYIQRLIQPYKSQPEWRAFLRVGSRNVPRLMTTGFRWSSVNMVPGHDRMFVDRKDEDFSPKCLSGCYKHHRAFWIQEKSGNPEWKGRLHVFSKDISTVLDFNVDSVARSLPITAQCWSLNDTEAYHFDRLGRCKPFNLIYPGVFLDGSWPWPRADENMDNPDNSECQYQAAKLSSNDIAKLINSA